MDVGPARLRHFCQKESEGFIDPNVTHDINKLPTAQLLNNIALVL